MFLFQLLLFQLIRRRCWQPLMILLLPGLECLPFLDLLCLELLLLLLVFLVLLGIARIWSGKVFRGRKILGMDCGGSAGARSLSARPICAVLGCTRGSVDCSTFCRAYCSAFFESAGPCRSCDGRLAVIGGSA